MTTILVYRKCQNPPDLDWHFYTQCPHWPKRDFEQVRYVQPAEGERLCEECTRLETQIFPSED